MKQDTLKRAQRALDLMNGGMSLTDATKTAGIDHRTFKKALKKLGVKRVKRRGKHYILEQYFKERIDRFIYYMMGGYSASRSAKEAHTTLNTMKRMKVKINNKSHHVVIKTDSRWTLNVYRLNGFHSVFFGRLFTRFGNVVTGSWDDGQDGINKDETDDDYANILWQIDFDPFTTSVMVEDVCVHYKTRVMKLLSDYFLKPVHANHSDVVDDVMHLCQIRPKYMAETMLKIDMPKVEQIANGGKAGNGVKVTRLETLFGQAEIEFDDEVQCGVDKRSIKEEYLTPAQFNMKKNRNRIDTGMFLIQVRRSMKTFNYPPKPMPIPFKHDILSERQLPRRSIRYDS